MDGASDEDFAVLKAGHERLLRERAAAVAALSIAVFNRPGLHDAVRSSASFRQLQSVDERLRRLEEGLQRLEHDAVSQRP